MSNPVRKIRFAPGVGSILAADHKWLFGETDDAKTTHFIETGLLKLPDAVVEQVQEYMDLCHRNDVSRDDVGRKGLAVAESLYKALGDGFEVSFVLPDNTIHYYRPRRGGGPTQPPEWKPMGQR